jgi:hypothetical protein
VTVTNGVGHSPDNTPMKQEALNKLAGPLLGSMAAIARKYGKNAVVLDMTCGRGLDDAGNLGSPLIIANHVAKVRERNPLDFVCVDRNRKNLKALQDVMQQIHPCLNGVRYETSQLAALDGLLEDTYGLAYYDPTHYTDLDVDLLAYQGQRFTRIDILFTRQCLAYLRMKGAAHTKDWALGIEDYLVATGKRCLYVMQYAKRDWWAFAFADNWLRRPPEMLKSPIGRLLSVDTSEGRKLLKKLMDEEEQTWDQPPLPGMEEA